MASLPDSREGLEVDWLAVCRRAGEAVERALARHPGAGERRRALGRGEGGDMTLAIDQAAEDAILAELEELGVPLAVVSEERGEVELHGGGPVRVVVDPIDGSLNAKRHVPLHGVSVAVADGPAMSDVVFGYVGGGGEEWWAWQGGGAFVDGAALPPLAPGGELEVLGIESANPRLVAANAEALASSGAHRLRALGSIALALCWVAAGRFDAMLSLWTCRSVDAAAGQLVVREAGGTVLFPDAGDGALGASLDLGMRSRVVAAADPEVAAALPRLGQAGAE